MAQPIGDDFVIDRVDWHTARKEFGTGLPVEDAESVRRRFRVLIDFLRTNGLLKNAAGENLKVGDDFELRKGDLTDEGFELIKAAYDTWLRALDRRKTKDPENVRLLRKKLVEMRKGSGGR